MDVNLTAEWRLYPEDADEAESILTYCQSFSELISLTGVACVAVSDRDDKGIAVIVTFAVSDAADEPKLKKVLALFHDVTIFTDFEI